MNRFFSKIFNHLMIFLILFFLSFLVLDDYRKWDKEFWAYNSKAFQTKKKYFENMYQNKKNINLLLGSSHMHRGVIPDSLGSNWFSFSNGSQTIYDSYKFLKYYAEGAKIDTIIISVAPFDFVKTYLTNDSNLPPNGNFIMFGADSISRFSHRLHQKAHLHKLKTEFFPDVFKLIPILKNRISNFKNSFNLLNASEKNYGEETFISKQGYLYNPKKNDNIKNAEALISSDNSFRKNTIKILKLYFSNISNKPNMKYFDLFNSFCLENDIKVIYMYPPTIKYFRNQTKKKYGSKWELIKKKIKEKNVTVWNYENFNDLKKYNGFFYDATHLSYDGAKRFSQELKNRLINERIRH